MKKDTYIRFVVNTLIKELEPEKIYLFGSRARKDNLPESDYDIAVEKKKMNNSLWSEVSLNIQENKPTLHKLDLVRLDRASKTLIEEIKKEGIILYQNESSNKKVRKEL